MSDSYTLNRLQWKTYLQNQDIMCKICFFIPVEFTRFTSHIHTSNICIKYKQVFTNNANFLINTTLNFI